MTKICSNCGKEFQTTGGRQTRCAMCQATKTRQDAVTKRRLDTESLQIKRDAIGQRISNGSGRPTGVAELRGQLRLRRLG